VTSRATEGTELPDEQSGEARGSDFVRSLERGLAVIRAFGKESPELTLSEVARATNLTRAAARRFLITLVDLGYVRTDGRTFALRPRVLELGYAYLSSLSLPEVAQIHLERLLQQVHETCSLAVLDGDDVVYVARVHTKRIMTLSISVGTRFPAYATSMGRVLLAHQDEDWLERYLSSVTVRPHTSRSLSDPRQLTSVLAAVRSQGYCLNDQELEEGLRSIAVPVRGASGSVIAAMNVSAHTSRGTVDAFRREVLPPLLTAAAAVHEDLVTR
jgi:IclR family pca regulon transcriptional regulator